MQHHTFSQPAVQYEMHMCTYLWVATEDVFLLPLAAVVHVSELPISQSMPPRLSLAPSHLCRYNLEWNFCTRKTATFHPIFLNVRSKYCHSLQGRLRLYQRKSGALKKHYQGKCVAAFEGWSLESRRRKQQNFDGVLEGSSLVWRHRPWVWEDTCCLCQTDAAAKSFGMELCPSQAPPW